MKIKLLFILLVGLQTKLNAQVVHDYKQGCCKLVGAINSIESCYCAGCADTAKKNKEAKDSEDKRVKELSIKKAEEQRQAAIARQKKENERIAQQNKDAKANTLHYGMEGSDKKDIKREDLKDVKERKKEHELAENELKKKIKTQLVKRKNSNSNEIDFEKFEFNRGTDEYIISYGGMPVNRIPKSRYEFIDYIFTTKHLQAWNYNKMKEVLDPLGDFITGLTHYRHVLEGNQIHLYVYTSSPEIIKGSATRNSKEVVNKMRGFYADRATAIHAINSYLPPSDKGVYYGPSMNIYVVEGKVIKTDLSLNVLEEEKGYFVDYENIK